MEDFEFSTDVFLDFAYSYGPNLLKAIAVLVLGLWVVKIIGSFVKKSA